MTKTMLIVFLKTSYNIFFKSFKENEANLISYG